MTNASRARGQCMASEVDRDASADKAGDAGEAAASRVGRRRRPVPGAVLGQCQAGSPCWVTWVLTEPSSSRLNPPAPREPTTSISASAAGGRRPTVDAGDQAL